MIGMLMVVTLFRVFVTYRAANAAALATHKFQTTLAAIVALKTHHSLPDTFFLLNDDMKLHRNRELGV